MFIIELSDGHETLEDMKRICNRIINHRNLVTLLSPEEHEDVSFILKPSLSYDHDEAKKRTHWQKLVNEFVLKNVKGEELRFYRDDKTQRLYFGDKEGFDTIREFAEKEVIDENIEVSDELDVKDGQPDTK